MSNKSNRGPICASDILYALYLLREDELKRYALTKKEIVVAQHILNGEGTAAIAKRLRLSVPGVKYHVRNILAKTKRRTREDFCALIRLGVADSKRKWRNARQIRREAEGRIVAPKPKSGQQA